jgi:hypothetical protein
MGSVFEDIKANLNSKKKGLTLLALQYNGVGVFGRGSSQESRQRLRKGCVDEQTNQHEACHKAYTQDGTYYSRFEAHKPLPIVISCR